MLELLKTILMNLYKIDGILWGDTYNLTPYCPTCRLALNVGYSHESPWAQDRLECEDCGHTYKIPRSIDEQTRYVSRKIESLNLKDIKVLNLDDEAIPIAEDKVSIDNDKYFVKAILTESKVGKRLVIYAGEKGKKNKTQIFVEPEIKRLAFDQKDIHPSDIFAKVEAVFLDGTISSIKSDEGN